MKSIRRMMRRVRAMFSGERSDAEMERELAAHLLLLEDEMMGKGATPDEARRLARIKLGGVEQVRIMHREERGLPFLESLAADVRLGWRQPMKRKVTTAAAVLSLGLAMGSCVAAFRLVDALFLRPLPIANPERLYVLSRQVIDQNGESHNSESWAYPDFVRMRDVSKKDADLIAVSFTDRYDLTLEVSSEQAGLNLDQSLVDGHSLNIIYVKVCSLALIVGASDILKIRHACDEQFVF